MARARTTRTGVDGPIVLTFSDADLHLLLRELTYAVSTVEAVRADVLRAADARGDAWVISTTSRCEPVVMALDRCVELLAEAQARSPRQ